VVEVEDPGATYWPGSPWSELGASEVNGVRDGDRHAWEVWHGLNIGAAGQSTFASRGEAVHFGRYEYDTGRFISEFGIHASPELATLERWTRPGSLDLHSPAFDHRNKDNPKNKGDALMDYETGLPTDLDQYVELSMACQAEGLKFGIEHYRRRQPSTSGTLVWQFNDPWPGITWSVLDYDGVPKASYYAVKRAYTPVLASFVTPPDGALELWLTNSGRTDVAGQVRAEVVTYAGASVLDETITVTAPSGTSSRVWSAPPDRVVAGPDRVAWVSSPDGLVQPNRAFFGRIKEQAFGPHHVEVTAVRDGRPSGLPVELDVTSHGYNYFTRVAVPYTGVSVSTNYLDLRPGQVVTVAIGGLPLRVEAATLRATSYRGPSRP
jgi:beta-mannosidase